MRPVVGFLLLAALTNTTGEARVNAKARASKAQIVKIDPAAVNDPANMEVVGPKSYGAATLRAQIFLDRANFSVGEIDGRAGVNFDRALKGFQSSRKLQPTGMTDPETWKMLNVDTAPALIEYTIAQEDVAGPFAPVPRDMMAQSKLPKLGYENALEGIAEKFHVSPSLLTKVNPGKQFDQANEVILVPNVITGITVKAGRIEVSKSMGTVSAFDPDGNLIAQYPATMGSEHDPLPIGEWKINGISKNPVFHYNPKLFWDADPSHSKAKIQPGPNNPVGVVWIDLSKEHYGIHGAPQPSKIGHTQSHGCIRLTNWDAIELAGMLPPGVPAILKE